MSAVAVRMAAAVPLLVRRALFVAAAMAVLVLSLTPVKHLPPQVFDLWDKAQHAGGFAVLTVLACWAWPGSVLRAVFALLLYGLFIEVAQSATGWRHGDLWDWLADAVGVLAGVLFSIAAQRWSNGLQVQGAAGAVRPQRP